MYVECLADLEHWVDVTYPMADDAEALAKAILRAFPDQPLESDWRECLDMLRPSRGDLVMVLPDSEDRLRGAGILRYDEGDEWTVDLGALTMPVSWHRVVSCKVWYMMQGEE